MGVRRRGGYPLLVTISGGGGGDIAHIAAFVLFCGPVVSFAFSN